MAYVDARKPDTDLDSTEKRYKRLLDQLKQIHQHMILAQGDVDIPVHDEGSAAAGGGESKSGPLLRGGGSRYNTIHKTKKYFKKKQKTKRKRSRGKKTRKNKRKKRTRQIRGCGKK